MSSFSQPHTYVTLCLHAILLALGALDTLVEKARCTGTMLPSQCESTGVRYIDPDEDDDDDDLDDIMLVDDLEDELGDPWGRDVFTPHSFEQHSDSPFTTAALLEQPSTSAYSAEGGAAASERNPTSFNDHPPHSAARAEAQHGTRHAGFEELQVSELVACLANSELVVVDVRSRDDYDAGHIPGAMSVPFDELSASACSPLAPFRNSHSDYTSAGTFVEPVFLSSNHSGCAWHLAAFCVVAVCVC
jgi:hypothetical protein